MFYFIQCSFMMLWLAGAIIAVTRWKQARSAAIASLAGFLFTILSGLLGLVSFWLGNTRPSELPFSPVVYSGLMRGLLYGEDILQFLGWTLVIIAFFLATKRKPASES